jgi:hypothetical protein
MKNRLLTRLAAAGGFILSASLPAAQAGPEPTEISGTIQSLTSSVITIEGAGGSPLECSCTKQTSFVDASGDAISPDAIKPGEATTVYYSTEAGHLVVDKVVCTQICPIVVDKKCRQPVSW